MIKCSNYEVEIEASDIEGIVADFSCIIETLHANYFSADQLRKMLEVILQQNHKDVLAGHVIKETIYEQ